MSTYTPLASLTLSSAQSSITFSGIPQTYNDLILVINAKVISGSAVNNYLRFNGDSGSNYSETRLYGNGSSASSSRQSNQSSGILFNDITSSENTADIVHIMNYTNNTTYKTTLTRANVVGSTTQAGVGLWRDTSAITSIEVRSPSTNFASGSTFNIYGIDASVSAQAKATGGDSIYTDSSYWYHVFNKSGTFVPSENLSNVDYLVVAGGGGGGSTYRGGGGGAGGLRCTVGATGGGGTLESKISLMSETSYTVTIGAGGTANNSGNNSTFSTITSIGGGKGSNGSGGSNNGTAGGSGGGGTGVSSPAGVGGAGTANQGFDGGTAVFASNAYGGGGGGAGAVGTNPNGGNGIQTSISGTATYFGGGGGAGGFWSGGSPGGPAPGGLGGGGAGGKERGGNIAATNGSNNTGGGGGGGNEALPGASGGSGIVIVRYPV